MGYYTWFSMTVEGEHTERFIQDLEAGMVSCEYGLLNELFEHHGGGHFDGVDSLKWYEAPNDMMHISQLYPNTLFVLHANGEDHEDFWRGYFRNGEKEIVSGEIVYAPPSEHILTNDVVVVEDDSGVDARAWM